MSAQSVQFAVLEAVVAALGGPTASVFRCRLGGFEPTQLPADNVVPESEDPSYDNTGNVEQRFSFQVRHMVAASDSAVVQADQLADQRYVRGAQLLLADPTLGGLVRRVKLVGRKWERERSELQIVVVVAMYEAEYSTTPRDPSVAGY